jgi:hypothetical protein
MAHYLIGRATTGHRRLRQAVEQSLDRGFRIGAAPAWRARQSFLDGADHGRSDVFPRGGGEFPRQRIRLVLSKRSTARKA